MRSAAAFARASASSRDRARHEQRPGAVGATAKRSEDVARLAVDPDLLDAGEVVGHLDALEHARRRDEELASPRRRPRSATQATRLRLPTAASIASPFRSMPVTRLDQLGVVAAAEPRGDLDHLRAVPLDAELGVATGRLDPEGLRPPRRTTSRPPRHCARPDVRERDAEGRRLGDARDRWPRAR